MAELLAKASLELWLGCNEHLKKYIDRQAMFQLGRRHREALALANKIPMPRKFPVTFDEFLRITVGGKYKGDRLKKYRDYAKDMIWLSHVHKLVYKNGTAVMLEAEAEKIALPASLDEIEAWINSVSSPIVDQSLYELRAGAFLDWLKKQPSERGKKAADIRWKKGGPKPEA